MQLVSEDNKTEASPPWATPFPGPRWAAVGGASLERLVPWEARAERVQARVGQERGGPGLL